MSSVFRINDAYCRKRRQIRSIADLWYVVRIENNASMCIDGRIIQQAVSLCYFTLIRDWSVRALQNRVPLLSVEEAEEVLLSCQNLPARIRHIPFTFGRNDYASLIRREVVNMPHLDLIRICISNEKACRTHRT